MSLHEFQRSRAMSSMDEPFYAMIMGAMRKADDRNLELLKAAFPAVWEELYARYHAPGGLLMGDVVCYEEEGGVVFSLDSEDVEYPQECVDVQDDLNAFIKSMVAKNAEEGRPMMPISLVVQEAKAWLGALLGGGWLLTHVPKEMDRAYSFQVGWLPNVLAINSDTKN